MIKVWLKYNLLENAVRTAFDKVIANFARGVGFSVDKFKTDDSYEYIVLDTFMEMSDGVIVENVTLTLRGVLIEFVHHYNMTVEVFAPYSKLEYNSKADRDLQIKYYKGIDAQVRINSDTSIVIEDGMSWCIDPREIISIKKR